MPCLFFIFVKIPSTMTYTMAEEKADEIIALYKQHGNDIYFGEAVTQLQHACQAAHRAHTEGYPDDIQLAAILSSSSLSKPFRDVFLAQ
jgi:hypothetical protein